MKQILSFLLVLLTAQSEAQRVQGKIFHSETGEGIGGITVTHLSEKTRAVVADHSGKFSIEAKVGDSLAFTSAGFETLRVLIENEAFLSVYLVPAQKELESVVVTGTMRPVKRLDSPVAVEVYTPQFFKKNPSPSIFESLQNVNGVRPQLNCSVCNTGDIHINGLEGPYTMITIDGMPIVSSLASVYGLFGIPTQLIERIEIVKGPASGLYGSEAIGGLINIITRSPDKAPLFTASFMTTSWKEHNLDVGTKFNIGKNVSSLLGVNYFNYTHALDKNLDQFTDIALQHRVSVFNKLTFKRKNNRVASLAGRFFHENRWGGETRWNKSWKGSDSIYAETITTNRWELIGNYQLPVREKMFFSFSATGHDQDAFYGNTKYKGQQQIGFAQLLWDKQVGLSHSVLTGLAMRYNLYDDNSTATLDTLSGANRPDQYVLPGLFVQDEWKINSSHLLLLGLRYDHHPVHKGIFTPRIAWKWNWQEGQVFRVNAGTGFRVVSLFTEEHAALTGARSVEVLETLNPERSYNISLNYTWYKKWEDWSLNVDASAWYSHFTNQIIADYDTDPNKIIYTNLDGYAASKGLTFNLEANVGRRFKSLAGVTLQDVRKVEKDVTGKSVRTLPVLTERWSAVWSVSYTFPAPGITIDYTGNVYGPMRLPLLSELDPRPEFSPVWSIQNIQITKLLGTKAELFCGVKNLLNWTPAKNTPFIIARSHDPFDKKVEYQPDGNILATAENPYALSFDPSYIYAPNQGVRFFGGVRFTVR